jgi:hypothetical protein
MAIRVGLLTAAVLICAWFALGIRATHDEAAATTILQQHNRPNASEAAQARSAIAAAEVLNPDQNLEILRGQIAFHTGNVAAALTIAKAIVTREPQNATAWLLLELFSDRIDPPLNRLAQERVSQLVPPAPAG